MNKLYYINCNFNENIHEIFDASLILMCASTYENVEVTFSSLKIALTKKAFSKINDSLYANVNFKRVNVYKKKGAIRDFIASLHDVYILLKGEKGATYLYSSINMFSIHCVNFISRLTSKRVIICCHSDLEILTNKNFSFTHYWEWLINRFFKTTRLSSKLRFMVLGDSILKSLQTIIPNRMKHFISIEHPYFDTSTTYSKTNTDLINNNFVKVGVVGIVNESRGGNNLLQFIQATANTNVKVYIISRLDPALFVKLKNECSISLNKENQFLERELYDSYTYQMDYLFYPYKARSFRLTASGAIYEAIVKKKPIISYSNYYFNSLFAKYGSFGIIIKDNNNMKDVVQAIMEKKDYQEMVEKTVDIYNRVHPLNCAENFRNKILASFDKESL